MLPRKVDWSILAQCDSIAVKKLVEILERPALQPIQTLRESSFERKLNSDCRFRDTFEAIGLAYTKLEPSFKFRSDNYGGYRLLFEGTEIVWPPAIFKRNPLGFVTPVPDSVVTDLSLMSSERTGQQMLVLGPIRFVNSDCNPNCEYDFSSDCGIVQLKVKRKVKPGDQFFVKYGPEFFEYNSCLCKTCELKRNDVRKLEADRILQEVLQFLLDIINEAICELKVEVSVISTPSRKTRKRKLRARDILESVHELTSSSLSFCESSPSSPPLDIGNVSLVADLSPFEWDCDSIVAASVCVSSSDEESVASNSNQVSDLFKFEQIVQLPAHNSLSTISDLCSVRMTVNDSFSQFSVDSDELVDNFSDMLFVGSDLSVRNASLLTDLFCSHFKLSDECSTVLHTLIKAFLPSPNNFPSGFSYVRNAKKMFQQEVRVLRKSPRQSFCVMSFVVQLCDTIQRNLDKILSYAEIRKQNPYCDLKCSLSPPVEMIPQGDLFFNSLLFSDGVNIKKSTLRKELWPIWIQIADLPPRQRMSRSNIILAALFVGNKTLNWNELIPHIKSELLSSIELKHNKK